MSEDGPLSPEETLRMEVLREWRKAYADENDIPAFLVFSNKTLRELAVRRQALSMSWKKSMASVRTRWSTLGISFSRS